jgi:hypothetical protein
MGCCKLQISDYLRMTDSVFNTDMIDYAFVDFLLLETDQLSDSYGRLNLQSVLVFYLNKQSLI